MSPIDPKTSCDKMDILASSQGVPLELRVGRSVKWVFYASIFCGALATVSWVIAPLICAAALAISAIVLAVLGIVAELNRIADKYLPRSLAHMIHVVYSVGLEFFLFFPSLFLYPAFRLLNKKISSGIPDKRPILLIHGYLHNPSAWFYFSRCLAKVGFRSIYTLHLKPSFNSLEFYVEKVKEKIKEIQKETGQEDVLLVGHSMGGVIASQAALDLSLSKACTLLSPLKGTPSAYLGFGQNARQMRPNSSFLQKLQHNLAKNDKVRFLHIASKVDLIVPAKYALVDPHLFAEQYIISDVGHLSILFSSTVAYKVAKWLNCS